MTALLLLSRSVCCSQKFISGKVAGGLGTCHPCHPWMLPNTALLFPGTCGSPPPGAEGSPGRDPGRLPGAVGDEGREGKGGGGSGAFTDSAATRRQILPWDLN